MRRKANDMELIPYDMKSKADDICSALKLFVVCRTQKCLRFLFFLKFKTYLRKRSKVYDPR